MEYSSNATVTESRRPPMAKKKKNTNYRWQQTQTITLGDSSVAQSPVKVLRMVLIKMLKIE